MEWNKEEIGKLILLFNDGVIYKEIGLILNRTETAIFKKLKSLNLTRNEWTDEDTSKSISLLKEGKNFKEISLIINKSHNSVAKKMRYDGYYFFDFNDSIEYKNRNNGIKKKKLVYESINWVEVQKFYENSSWAGIREKFGISFTALTWAVKNEKLKTRTIKESREKRTNEERILRGNEDSFKEYRLLCDFKFWLQSYKDEFDFSLIEKYGWYGKRKGEYNLEGVSRDHMVSVKYGFLNNVDPKIIAHPANCKLMQHKENGKKKDKNSITLEELLVRIEAWDLKYNTKPAEIMEAV